MLTWIDGRLVDGEKQTLLRQLPSSPVKRWVPPVQVHRVNSDKERNRRTQVVKTKAADQKANLIRTHKVLYFGQLIKYYKNTGFTFIFVPTHYYRVGQRGAACARRARGRPRAPPGSAWPADSRRCGGARALSPTTGGPTTATTSVSSWTRGTSFYVRH